MNHGLWSALTALCPTAARRLIMISLAPYIVRRYLRLENYDTPKAKFTKADGVKGKRTSIKSVATFVCSTHLRALSTFGCLSENLKNLSLKRCRNTRNTMVHPTQVPIQLYRKPRNIPWAATFTRTMATSGRGGIKDSRAVRSIGASGPRCLKLFKSSSQKSRDVILFHISCNMVFCSNNFYSSVILSRFF